jgi:hypothetical protein
VFIRGLHTSHNPADSRMKLYCPDCLLEVTPEIIDNSFDHEFGTEVFIDSHCPECLQILHTSNVKPKRN